MELSTYKPDISQYLPSLLRKVREFAAITDTQNKEFVELWKCIEDVLNAQFLDDLSIVGIERWEDILELGHNEALPDEDRRLRIKSKVNRDGTFTYKKLQDSLSSICGDNGYTCELQADNYTLVVRIALTSRNQFDFVKELLEDVTPANLIIDLSLLYNQHQTLKRYSHEQLFGRSHHDLRNHPEFTVN